MRGVVGRLRDLLTCSQCSYNTCLIDNYLAVKAKCELLHWLVTLSLRKIWTQCKRLFFSMSQKKRPFEKGEEKDQKGHFPLKGFFVRKPLR